MSSAIEVATEVVAVMAKRNILRTQDIPVAIQSVYNMVCFFKEHKDKENRRRKHANGDMKRYLQLDATCRKIG